MTTIKLFGPPGTGKTTALLNIMERELSAGVRPDRLAFLTFTVHARREALDRAMTKFNRSIKDFPYFRTLHSIAYEALGISQAALLHTTKQLKPFGDLIGVTFTDKQYRPDEDGLLAVGGREEGDMMLAFDHYRRHCRLDVDQALKRWPDELNPYAVRRFTTAYEQWKQREGYVDFTDMLERVQDALPIDVLIVDEAQDLSELQWKVVDIVGANAQRVYIAGDDDQAIFTWAGASPEAFVQRPGQVKVLGVSHRLPRAVHQVATRIVSHIVDRQAKTFAPRDEAGIVNLVQHIEGINFEAGVSHRVLYRNHWMATGIEEHLRTLGVPYSKDNRPARALAYGSAVVAWERLVHGRAISFADAQDVIQAIRPQHGRHRQAAGFLRREAQHTKTFTLDYMQSNCGLELGAMPWFQALSALRPDDVQYLRAVIRRNPKASALLAPPQLQLSTIHAAKGTEADHVTLLTELSGKSRETYDRTPDAERRVFYVGATRARRVLNLVGLDNPIFL